MNTPTQAQRNKIDFAIDKVTSLCTEDPTLTPSEAIVKVATDMQLTQDYLPIIVRAYNTGAAAIHREGANTVQEKVASYPIADLDTVYSLLLQEHPFNKTAAVAEPKDSFWKFNADYYWPDAWDYLKSEPDFSDWRRPQVKMAHCTDYKDKLDRNASKTITMIADEATRVKQAAILKRDQALDDVEYELCKYAGVDLNDARRYAELAYGQEGLNVINKIIQDNRLEKKARVKMFLDDDHPFAKAFERFVDNNEQVKKASIQERQILEACIDALGETVQPKDRYVEGMSEIDRLFKEAELHHGKKKFFKQAYTPLSADPVTGMTGLEMLNHPGWGGLDPFERELMYGLTDPRHESELRQIRVQTILTDLLNTDPYLKEKDPDEVIDAINEILEVNPDLHNNKPMLRVALRQYMESGGLDIPTLGMLGDYGKEDRDRKAKEESERADRGIRAGQELNRRVTEQEERDYQREYQRARDAEEDKRYSDAEKKENERYKSEQKIEADERKWRKDNAEAEATARKDQAEADRKSREQVAKDDRDALAQQHQDDLNFKNTNLYHSNLNSALDRTAQTDLEKLRNTHQREMERDRRKYELAHEQWQDYGAMSPARYNTYYGSTTPPTKPDPTRFF